MDKIIFKTIKEMQGYFSHIPGTIELGDMQTDIILAQEELEKFVGPEIVEEAVEFFNADPDEESSGSGEDSALKTKLVTHVQMAVAFMAYREYALNNDATHTKTGRTARMDRDSDQFDAKLIDRDDMALRRKIQTAIDRLIKFVDANKFESWVNSDIYKETRDLLIWNTELFHRFHPIERSHYLYMLMLPMIRTSQNDFIAPVLGPVRMASLLARVQANNIHGDASGSGSSQSSVALLFDKAGSAICYLALSASYRELPVQLFPESMSRQFWNAGNGLAFVGLRDKVIEALKIEGMRKLDVLMHYIQTLETEEAAEDITDDDITTVAERMLSTNKFVRV